MRHHVLQDSVSHIADEQVMLRMPIRHQRDNRVRVISYHASSSWFQVPPSRFVLSVTHRLDSCYQLPPLRFVVSVTEIEISVTKIRGISYRVLFFSIYFQQLLVSYPQLNTIFNTYLTPTRSLRGIRNRRFVISPTFFREITHSEGLTRSPTARGIGIAQGAITFERVRRGAPRKRLRLTKADTTSRRARHTPERSLKASRTRLKGWVLAMLEASFCAWLRSRYAPLSQNLETFLTGSGEGGSEADISFIGGTPRPRQKEPLGRRLQIRHAFSVLITKDILQ